MIILVGLAQRSGRVANVNAVGSTKRMRLLIGRVQVNAKYVNIVEQKSAPNVASIYIAEGVYDRP